MIRKEIIIHYGGKCACCGYADIDKQIHGQGFLQIDKIDGGHRKLARELKMKGEKLYGNQFYYWLKKNSFPHGYRVLDSGCNNAMEPGGTICEIHKKVKMN